MKDTRQIFAQNLSKLIAERGIEQQALAFALDVGTSTVSAWTLGQRFPRADKMQELADYFHVSISELVDEPGSAVPNGDTMALREQLRRQPNARLLLDAVDGATEEEILRYAAMINALRKDPHDDT